MLANFLHKKFVAFAVLLLTVFSLLSPALAAVNTAYDLISSHKVTVSANHEIHVRIANGINAPTDTMVLDFTGFSIGSVDAGDVDIFHGPVTGVETGLAHAAAAGIGVWGVGIGVDQITLTPPTDAGAGSVPAGDWFVIRVGTNAAGGLHRMVNSVVPTQGLVDITGGFGQIFQLALPIITDDSVAVTGQVGTIPPPPPPPPPPPGGGATNPVITNIQAINITDSSARIIWDTDQGATSVVEYGLTNAYGLSLSNSSLVFSHGLDLTFLSPSTTYHFRVSSTNQTGNQTVSNDYTFTTLNAPPLLISNVTSTSITDVSAIVIWDTNRPASSVVGYGTTPSLGLLTSVAGDVTQHSIALNALQYNTTYYYQVFSQDAYGSVTSSVYTFHTAAHLVPPTNVHLTATAGDASVLLQWDHPPEPDFAGVIIRRRTDGYPTGPTDGDLVYNGLAVTHLDQPLINGVTYYYAAYAYNVFNNYSSGALAHATPIGLIIPPTPTTTPPIPPTPTTTPPIPPVIPPIIPPVTPPIIPPTPTTTPPIPPMVVPPITPTTTPPIIHPTPKTT